MKIRKMLFILLLIFPLVSQAIVRFNPMTGFWEGNMCATMNGIFMTNFQPIGSFCQIMTPMGMVIQGQIANM